MYLPRITLTPTFIRELVSKRSLPREPEPDAIMAEADQVAAFTETGRKESTLAASYLFHTARASQVIGDCRRVIDLGCGPATQLSQIAAMNPEIEFTGLDMSEEMLRHARLHVTELGLDNIDFLLGDITALHQFDSGSIDGVISTVSLHHLPTHEHLDKCFAEINRVLTPEGSLYLADFGRLKSLKSVIFFAYMNRGRDAHQLLLDYERSLRAAFLPSDFTQLARDRLPLNVEFFSTFKMPLLMILKTMDKPLSAEKIDDLKQARSQLNPRFRRDLDDVRLFFKLGGLQNDPFR